MSKVVVAVVVTYHPDIDALNRLIEAIIFQVDRVVVVDNGSSNVKPLDCKFDKSVEWILNPENVGVAAAYNQGIDFARKVGATHLVLFDQDSVPAPDMVACLLTEFLAQDSHQAPIAASGPKYTDIKGQAQSPFVRLTGFGLRRIDCEDDQSVEVDHLISSGCLISLAALDAIGAFREELFIDYVDTEWCWRARRKGFRLLGVGAAKMQHSIGDAQLVVFGKCLPLHTPFRLYYQFRNQWWMILQPWVGWRWRIMDIIRSIKIFCAFAIFSPRRFESIKFMCKGIWDGLCSRMINLPRSK